ncbi:MAG: hypothetical protein HRT68_02260 [Flavobacteriaceae bacterium]|nr:hypothetical protein [Flavobacteriaceae bacterium]
MKKDNSHNNQNSGFKTPENYFEKFDDRLFARLSLKDEHPEVTLEQETGFTVPEEYFNSFEERLFDKLSEEKMETKVIPLFSKRTWTYVASIAAVVLLAIPLFFTNTGENEIDIEKDLSNIEIQEYLDYFSSEEFDLNTVEFASLSEEDIAELEEETNTIENELLLEYLSNEEITDDLLENL